MIGVIADSSERAVIREFFELFKTPWEFYRDGRHYDVVLCSTDPVIEQLDARILLVFGAHGSRSKVSNSFTNPTVLRYRQTRLPIYCGSATFSGATSNLLTESGSGASVIYETQDGKRLVTRIGYDLFNEVEYLLRVGQPAANAGSPTLDLHIALLRDLIRSSGVSFVEVPPVPSGYRFIACLTHDIDHPRIRLHKFDHTAFGFLYRAVIGSAIDTIQGRMSAWNMLQNWVAAFKFPLMHLGLVEDFWESFDRYLEIEGDRPSSFYAIPFKEKPGQTCDGPAPSIRGAAYSASDIADQLRRIVKAGREVGLHGIDAWIDSTKALEEVDEIRSITGNRDLGVRMHWLYFNEDSPTILENAGANYDSTIGYNETVGFRAGTSQAFKPLKAKNLLELPLHIMDTALFYPSYLHLSPKAAVSKMSGIINHAVQHGGCITVNWHDRSIAPERLWIDSYEAVIRELREKGAWFATASQAVNWFRLRRSVVFEMNSEGFMEGVVRGGTEQQRLPGFSIKKYEAAVSKIPETVLPAGAASQREQN